MQGSSGLALADPLGGEQVRAGESVTAGYAEEVPVGQDAGVVQATQDEGPLTLAVEVLALPVPALVVALVAWSWIRRKKFKLTRWSGTDVFPPSPP